MQKLSRTEESSGPKGPRSLGENPDDDPIKIDDLVLGMKYASVAITDDEPGTLAKVGKANPWHIEALRIITGSEEEAHKPLSTILSKHMGLECDKIIDISGMTPAGHPLDTQGYIAHNDETIVLSYRCTTSLKDWLTNFNTTPSVWELDEDIEQGFSGHFSGMEAMCGGCCSGKGHLPKVHTGFYNNFLACVPDIKQYIEPLLQPDQPPRKLYVVGHSLGAGIATLASCYFLLQHDWVNSPHKFISVTAGSPRAVQESMKVLVDEEMAKLRPLDKAVMCRLVRDKDVVPTVPPSIFGFKHLGRLVHITKDGQLLVEPDEEPQDENQLKALLEQTPTEEEEIQEEETLTTNYDRMVAKIPRPFRDHMPDFYLKPLIKMFEVETGIKDEKAAQAKAADDLEVNHPVEGGKEKTRKRKKFRNLFSRKKKVNAAEAVEAA